MEANSFDHVALWVDERDALSRFLCDVCGMHEIERTDRFTLVGGDAREGKLTLFDADGPRDRGVLERIVLRVPDVDACLERRGRAGSRPTRTGRQRSRRRRTCRSASSGGPARPSTSTT